MFGGINDSFYKESVQVGWNTIMPDKHFERQLLKPEDKDIAPPRS